MQIQLLLFGITRDIIGLNDLTLRVTEGSTVGTLKEKLQLDFPGLNEYNYSVAVNETYAEESQILNENDTVALIPPVSGG